MRAILSTLCLVIVMLFAFSTMAANKVVVVPLFSSGDKVPTVVSKTGRVWMDRNLGAIRVAGSMNDSLAYGWLYQWGRPADGHENPSMNDINNSTVDKDVPGHGWFITANYPYDWRVPKNDDLWQGVAGVNNPCPQGFRLPTEMEWLLEINSWNPKSDVGAFESPLKLVLAGAREADNAVIWGLGRNGYYWSSTYDFQLAKAMCLQDGYPPEVNGRGRAEGMSVRCIKD